MKTNNCFTKRFLNRNCLFIVSSIFVMNQMGVPFLFGDEYNVLEQMPDSIIVASANQSRNTQKPISSEEDTKISLPEKKANTESSKKKSIVLEGEIDGEGTFTFQNNKIVYKHAQLKPPKNVTVNNKKWENLDKPFELGFVPDYSSTKIVERNGRNPIRVIPSHEDVEVYFFDTDDSSSKYRVALQFNVSAIASKEKTESKSAAVDKPKTTKAVDIEMDDGPIRNEDKLPGVFYDLRRSSKGLDYASKKGINAISLEHWQKIIKAFVDGHWMNSTDSNHIPDFQYFSGYYHYHENRYDSYFKWNMSGSEIGSFFPDQNASTNGFVGLHAGYVKAPFSGKIRFVGSGADAFAVHFDGKLAFEYIYGVNSTSTGRVTVSRASSITKKNVFNVVKDKVYPIKIMYSSIHSNGVSVSLSVQKLDSNGEDLGQPVLFRTTSESPSTTTSASNTRTKNASQTTSTVNSGSSDSQIWKVTDYRGYRIKPREKKSVEKLKFQ